MGYDAARWQAFAGLVERVRTVGQAHALAVAALGLTRAERDELASSYVGGKFSDEAAAAAARASALQRLGAVELALASMESALRALRVQGRDADPLPVWARPLVVGEPPLAIAGGVILGELAPHVAAYEAKAGAWFARMLDALYRGSGASGVLPFATGAQAFAVLALAVLALAFVASSGGRALA